MEIICNRTVSFTAVFSQVCRIFHLGRLPHINIKWSQQSDTEQHGYCNRLKMVVESHLFEISLQSDPIWIRSADLRVCRHGSYVQKSTFVSLYVPTILRTHSQRFSLYCIASASFGLEWLTSSSVRAAQLHLKSNVSVSSCRKEKISELDSHNNSKHWHIIEFNVYKVGVLANSCLLGWMWISWLGSGQTRHRTPNPLRLKGETCPQRISASGLIKLLILTHPHVTEHF